MQVYESKLYQEDIKYIASLNIPWEKLNNKIVLISGASGLIGSCFIDTIMEKNKLGLNCKIYALGRNREKAKKRFGYCWNNTLFEFITYDINQELSDDNIGNIDYMLHLASNTHPVAYAKDPIGTITTNIIGTNNMLKFAADKDITRFAFASSNEIYGENRGDVEKFGEDYCGYINSNTMRAGYPESKRCGEALCQAYIQQEKMDIVVPRLTRSYGPTMLMSDTKAISQFIRKAIENQDIILKSEGMQYYSYTYVADAVAGLFTVLLCGKSGEAYNIADDESDIRLKDLANIIADSVGKKVIFELPEELEKAGYSKATKARLESSKLKELGWKAKYDIKQGIKRTLEILREIQN